MNTATPHVASASAMRVDLATVRALASRDLRRFFRQPSRIIGSVAQPLVLWALLGLGLSSSFAPPGAGSVSYLSYFFPGTLVLVVLFTAVFSTISVIEDRHHGFLQAVLVAPGSRAALALGKTLGGATIALFQAGLLVLFAPLAGVDLGDTNWPLLAAALALGCLGFCAMGLALAWWIDSSQGYHAIMGVLLIPLWMVSGAMFPAAGGGPTIQLLMAANPITYVVSAVRRALAGDDASVLALLPASSSAQTELLAAAAFALAAIGLAVLTCGGRKARRPRRARAH